MNNFSLLRNCFDEIIKFLHSDSLAGILIGKSRLNSPIYGYQFGSGGRSVSLLAGCHSDEPIGPLFLNCLVKYLANLPLDHSLLQKFTWWIVPDINPDGAKINAKWFNAKDTEVNLSDYLEYSFRELPGDDIEFGFPNDKDDILARPENVAIYNWWKTARNPFSLHASLHGMAFAGGAWYLLAPDWVSRSESLIKHCSETTKELGFELHDVERNGEKGFARIQKGFCTHPNSQAMKAYFKQLKDEETAKLFRPSSMETIKSFGGDPLTLVSELPLFIVQGMGELDSTFENIANKNKDRLMQAKSFFVEKKCEKAKSIVNELLEAEIVKPMPIVAQMKLQWSFIAAGLELVS